MSNRGKSIFRASFRVGHRLPIKNGSITCSRSGFTLIELVLAVSLSVVLVGLIATAINLYLTRVDNGRTQVEEAQLARSILAMIADDVRAATIYQPQDTSAIAQLMASGTPFDVDSIDDPRSGGSGGTGGTGGTPGTSASAATGGGTGSATGSSTGGSTGGMSATGGVSAESESTMPLGLNGTVNELYVDSTRLPRRDELFATATGYTNAPTGLQNGSAGASGSATSLAGVTPPSDLKSVRYFIRPGEAVEAGSAAATSLAPEAQLRAGGLIRQEIPRSSRLWAEQSGNSAVLDSGQALIAPEVVNIQFRYFDGTQVLEVWDMVEKSCLPVAIEVSLWIAPPNSDGTASFDRFNALSMANNAHEYRQTIYLPMSQLSSAGAAAGAGGATSQTGSGTSSTGSSATGASSGGSSFGSSQSGF